MSEDRVVELRYPARCLPNRGAMAPALLFRSTGLDLLRHLKVSDLAGLDLSAYAAIFSNRKRTQAISLGFLGSAHAKGDEIMPLVRIDLRKGKDLTYRQEIGRVVYEAMVAVAGVPANARFQVVSEHDADNFLFDAGYLGIDRSDDLVIIQITWNEGRTAGQKKALYKAITEGLGKAPGIRPEDVFINLVDVRFENWSIGKGEAQYAS
jgi:4-oxalocrotonate tautomerase